VTRILVTLGTTSSVDLDTVFNSKSSEVHAHPRKRPEDVNFDEPETVTTANDCQHLKFLFSISTQPYNHCQMSTLAPRLSSFLILDSDAKNSLPNSPFTAMINCSFPHAFPLLRTAVPVLWCNDSTLHSIFADDKNTCFSKFPLQLSSLFKSFLYAFSYSNSKQSPFRPQWHRTKLAAKTLALKDVLVF